MGKIIKFAVKKNASAMTGTDSSGVRNNRKFPYPEKNKFSKLEKDQLLQELKGQLFGFNDFSDAEKVSMLKDNLPALKLNNGTLKELSALFFEDLYRNIDFQNFYKDASVLTKSYNTNLLETIFNKLFKLVFENIWDELPLDSLYIVLLVELQLENIYCFHLDYIILDIMEYFSEFLGFDEADIDIYKTEIEKVLWPVLILSEGVNESNVSEISSIIIDQFKKVDEDLYDIENFLVDLRKIKKLDNISDEILEDSLDTVFEFLITKNFLAFD